MYLDWVPLCIGDQLYAKYAAKLMISFRNSSTNILFIFDRLVIGKQLKFMLSTNVIYSIQTIEIFDNSFIFNATSCHISAGLRSSFQRLSLRAQLMRKCCNNKNKTN